MALQTKIIIKATATKAMKTMLAFGGVLKKITFSVFSMRSALVALGGAAGFGYMVKSSLNATDSLAKTASKIGTTTEALSKLQYAAGITGVETNTLNMAMQRFTRRTAEAAQGTGEAKGAIKELGLDARKLQQLPLDQQMMKLAGAFGNVQSDADKLRIAFKLFDSEGAALVNTLALGSDGLEKMFGRAKALGIVMTSDAAAGAERANDALSDLFSIARGIISQFSAALAPALEFVAKKLTDFFIKTKEAEGGIAKFAQTLASNFLEGLRSAVLGLSSFASKIDQLSKKAATFFDEIEVKALGDRVDWLRGKYEKLGTSLGVAMTKGFDKLSAFDQLRFRNIENLEEAWGNAFRALVAGKEELSEFVSSVESSGTSLADLFDNTAINTFFDDMVAGIGKIGEATSNVIPTAGEQLNSFEKGVKSFSDSIPSMEENLKSLTHQGLDGLTDSLTAAVTGAANFKDAMKSMAKSVVDSLIKMLIQKYIVDAAFGAITGFIGGSGTSPVAGGKPSVPVMSSAGSRPMSPRAIGGSVQAGQPYMVGERGQEMFVPNQSGSIIPNNKMGDGGGVVVNQTINISTGVAQTVRAEVAGLMPQIAAAAKGAVADARQRGGGYSQALIGA